MSAPNSHVFGEKLDMHDSYISKALLIDFSLWILASLLMAGTWLLAFLDAPLRYEVALAATATGAVVLAREWQARTYVHRICSLMRVASGLESGQPDLRAVDR